MKIELDKMKEDNKQLKRKGRMPPKRWNVDKIAEEDE
jgi:hypothetical protein